MGEPSKKQAEQAVKRTDKGQFARGQSGNPSGRPKGAANKAMQLLRSWTLSTGLPRLIEQAEAGDQDALRLLVTLGLPRVKPQAAPIEGIGDLPLPKSPSELDKVHEAIFWHTTKGDLSLEDADALMKLAERLTDAQTKADWKRTTALHDDTEEAFASLGNVNFADVRMDFSDVEPVDTVKITAKRSFKEQ